MAVPDATTIKIFLLIMYWMAVAMKYPSGFLQSNGSLQRSQYILQKVKKTFRIFNHVHYWCTKTSPQWTRQFKNIAIQIVSKVNEIDVDRTKKYTTNGCDSHNEEIKCHALFLGSMVGFINEHNWSWIVRQC